ncbi:MAG: TolC family protein [Mucinivorans sp.]
MRKIFIFLILFPVTAFAQTTVEQCYQGARENYPLTKRYDLIEKTKQYSLKNAAHAYLPQGGLSAKATIQTDVLTIPMPGVPELSKDQYQVGLEINQAIWDGGAVHAQKQSIKAGAQVESRQLDVDLYTLNDRVNNLFFGILTLNEQLVLNDLLRDELQRNLVTIGNYVASGIASSSDLDAVKVEILDNRQKRASILASRDAYMAMLNALVGFQIKELVKPNIDTYGQIDTLEIKRPELSLFNAQVASIDTKRYAITAQNMPQIGAFVQGAYGDPGLDMFKLGFTPYAIGGVRLSWNFGKLYNIKNEKAKIEVEKNTVNATREAFLFNTNLELEETKAEVRRLRTQMNDDEQIILLRGNIKRASEAKVAGGTLSVSDMLSDVTAENAAMQNKALHEIELLMTIYKIKYKTNN